MSFARVIVLAAVVTALSGCSSDLVRALPAPVSASSPATPEVILISMDGYRADYLARGDSPVLDRLSAAGVRARWMIPSFPTVTEPNHYTLLTGLYPDDNGIVDNDISDRQIQPMYFEMTHSSTMRNPEWWSEATPLWVSVQREGMRSGEVSWPSGWVRVDGLRPDLHFGGVQAASPERATSKVLRWLELPADQRPRFIMLHYEPIDHVGHHYGPDSPEEDDALRQVDSALGRLVDGLKQDGLYTNTDLIIVSDHGMATVAPGHQIYIDDIVHRRAIELVTLGANAGIDPHRGAAGSEAEKKLLGPHPHMRCWRKQDLPSRLHYGHNSRVPSVICIASPGWVITTHWAMEHRKYVVHGIHGYDNLAVSMRAIFVAEGPSFRRAIVVPPFSNVDVYPLLAHILGVKAEHNDGDFARVAPLLKTFAP